MSAIAGWKLSLIALVCKDNEVSDRVKLNVLCRIVDGDLNEEFDNDKTPAIAWQDEKYEILHGVDLT